MSKKCLLLPILASHLTGTECSILDFGCGSGRFTPELAQTIGGTAVGIDICEELLWLALNTTNVRYQVMPTDFPGQHALSYDAIWVCLVLGGIPRDDFLVEMTKRRIGVGVHYRSVCEHPYYQQRLGWRPEDHPHAMAIGRQTVSLPISAKLSEANVERIITAVKKRLSGPLNYELHSE